MTKKSNNRATDLRGLSALTIDAVLGVTDIVESLHLTIAGGSAGTDPAKKKRTNGITGLVYRNVRAVTKLVGSGLDVPLGRLSSVMGEDDSSPSREAALSAVNGILGDHLVARDNPLAIPMKFRRNGQPLTKQTLAETVRKSNGKLAIMVHGLCMNDLHWQRQEHDHGAAIANDLGFEPLYLHYNTGLHISENGQEFSDLLESLVEQAGQRLELVIIAHSMGGLVSRSACYYGEKTNHIWPTQLRKLLFLGTPHHGAPLEKGGNWIDVLLGKTAYSAPFARLGKTRSCGVTDMRYGNIVDADWNGSDRFDLMGDQRQPVPLPTGVDCYAIAATTSKEFNVRGEDIIGDGLVMVGSALGHHKRAELALSLPDAHQWVGRDMNHLDLLSHPGVYEKIKGWLGG